MRNNNSPSIRKLTKRSFVTNKGRNIFVISAIVLTCLLITAVFSMGMSIIESEQMMEIRVMGTSADSYLASPTDDQMEYLKNSPLVKNVGLQTHIANIIADERAGNTAFFFQYLDSDEWQDFKIPAITNIVGEYPEKENEVAMSRWALEKMGVTEPEIGMEVSFTYYDPFTAADGIYADMEAKTETFTLSGFYTSYQQTRGANAEPVLVSEAFAVKSGRIATSETAQVSIKFASGKDVPVDAYVLETEMGLEEGAIRVSPMHLSRSSNDTAYIAFTYGAIIALVMFCGYLLIYNVMLISVSNEIRFFGLLKTIGTTPKQIRKIVRRQGILLSAIGIPLGLAIGALVSLVAVPMVMSVTTINTGTVVSANPIVFIGAGVFSFITTMTGTVKPASVASKISAIEAVRYTENGVKKQSKPVASLRNKVVSMALRNAARDKKRTCVVILSMFLGITIFLTVTSILSALKVENYLGDYARNDFSIECVNPFSADNGDAETAQINAGVTDIITAIDGVENVSYSTIAIMTLDFTPDFDAYVVEKSEYLGVPSDAEITDLWGIIAGVDGKDLLQSESDPEYQFDVEAFDRGEFALFSADAPENLRDIKTISIRFDDAEETTTIDMNGFVNMRALHLPQTIGPNVLVSRKYLESIYPNTPPIYRASFDVVDELEELIDARLEQYFSTNYSYTYTSRLKTIRDFNSMKQSITILGTGVSLVLASIGVLNFVNIICTGIMTRTHELAMLESIGMSKKQIRKMNLLEGLFYFIITAILSSTLGTFISYAMVELFKKQASYAVFEFPAVPLITILIIISAVCIITPSAAYKISSKGTTVERLRET